MAVRWLIELDGVVLDLHGVHWDAYGRAAAEIDSARMARAEFDRLMRLDTPPERLVRYARPLAATRFAERFAAWCEDVACWAAVAVPEAATAALRTLGRASDRVAMTQGRNRAARQAVLERNGATALFMEMQGLNHDPRRRSAELRALAGDHPAVVVVAGTVEVASSAAGVDLPVVGIPNARATARRLTQQGCGWVADTLLDIADDLAAGGPNLQRLGVALNRSAT